MRTKNLLRVSTLAIVVALLVFSGNALLAANKPAAGKVDLNSADLKTLEALPGVGAATAKHIIAARPFKSVEDLKHVKGIGDAKFAALKDKVSVGRAAAAPAPGPGGLAAPAAPAKPAAPVAKAAPAGLVDLNGADAKTLEALPGVGAATAKAIIAARPFKGVDDLKKVKGIGDGVKFAALKDKVTVGAAPAAPAAPVAPTAPAKPAAPVAAAPAAPAAPAAAAAPAAPAAKSAAPKLAPGQKININTATKEQLDMLPDIGGVKAQAIIDGRPYQKIEDIMKVKGIKEGIFAKIKDHITVN